MENFRELEKEYKKKQFSKKSLQGSKHGKGGAGAGRDSSDEDGCDSDEDENGDYSDDDDYSGSGEDDDQEAYGEEGASGEEEVKKESTEIEDPPEKRLENANYLKALRDFIKGIITKAEQELEVIKNKKVKGSVLKKQKEK